MANFDHLKILNQGVQVWNKWRKNNLHIIPNLNDHQFIDSRGNSTANFRDINLDNCCLVNTNFTGANLRDAKLSDADLRNSNLHYADLSGADLSLANMTLTILEKAILRDSTMHRTNLCTAYLDGADLTGAHFNQTILCGLHLIGVVGLSDIEHSGPSFMDIETILYSGGELPKSFLKGIGISEAILQHIDTLKVKSNEFYNYFISHSFKDKDFAERLHTELQTKGVRCWLNAKDLNIGNESSNTPHKSIQEHDILLLVLSEHSINIEWVKEKVNTAYEQERKRKWMVIVPILLDDAAMSTDQRWAAKLRRSRHIFDFKNWKDQNVFKNALDRLLRHLNDKDAYI